jgi:hypothetical protein
MGVKRLKVIRKSGYASNFPLNIRALCQNLYIRLQNFNFHPDRFSSIKWRPNPLSSLDLPTPVKINQFINAFTGWTWCEIDCLFIWRFYIWTFGFPFQFEGLQISFYANYNLLSAEQNPEIVSTIYKWSRGVTCVKRSNPRLACLI